MCTSQIFIFYIFQVDGNTLKDETPAHLIQLFKISQSLMKVSTDILLRFLNNIFINIYYNTLFTYIQYNPKCLAIIKPL